MILLPCRHIFYIRYELHLKITVVNFFFVFMVCVQILAIVLVFEFEDYHSILDAVIKRMSTAVHCKNISGL